MGERFRFLTAGESHGETLGAIVEGVPAGLALTAADLAVDLRRRQGGYGRGARQQIEHDEARIVAGVRHGRTLGSPILLLVANRDFANWGQVMQVEPLTEADEAELKAAAADGNKKATPVTRVRPGHGDLAGALKYGHEDVRNVLERATILSEGALIDADHLTLQSGARSLRSDTTDLSVVERTTIAKVLQECRGNKTKAARRLGLSRTQVHLRVRKYGLEQAAAA